MLRRDGGGKVRTTGGKEEGREGKGGRQGDKEEGRKGKS